MQSNNTQQLPPIPKDLEFVHHFERFTEQRWRQLTRNHFLRIIFFCFCRNLINKKLFVIFVKLKI